MRTQLPPKRGTAPHFSANVYCGRMVGWIKVPLSTKVGLGPSHVVLDGDPAPSSQRGTPPFWAHVCCGQTGGWIKMPLGTEVDLGPGHIVLDGDPACRRKGHNSPPVFGPCVLWPNGRPSQVVLSTCQRKYRKLLLDGLVC